LWRSISADGVVIHMSCDGNDNVIVRLILNLDFCAGPTGGKPLPNPWIYIECWYLLCYVIPYVYTYV
jgi:hypothetical protein